MPLLKLWNLLLGRSNQPAGRASGVNGSHDNQPIRDPRATTTSQPEPKKTPPRRGASVLKIGGRGPHAALCKNLRRVTANTVLEISVGDGTRATAVLQTLSAHNETIRYAAIDEFESSGGPVSLLEFHRSLRSNDVRAQLFPGTIERGLYRVANTIGTIDLVLIATPPDTWQTPVVLPQLSRIMHAHSQVFYHNGETWDRYCPTTHEVRRAA